jgi:hypothetical protein
VKLTPAQADALGWARNLEAEDMSLVNGVGVSIVTAHKLRDLDLVTMDEGWETPWAPGFKKPRQPTYVWSVKLTEAGRALANSLAPKPLEAQEER